MSQPRFIRANDLTLQCVESGPVREKDRQGGGVRTISGGTTSASSAARTEAGPPRTTLPRTDRPPLVFIHALGCDLNLWEAVGEALSAEHRIVRYDLRGHGCSDCGPEECTLDDHARDLEGLLRQLGITSATLVGISVGGLIAMAMALRVPARVRRLVLCATGARIGTREGWNERIAAVRTQGLDAMADAILGRWFTPAFAQQAPAAVRDARERLVRTPVIGYAATCAALRDADLRADVARIRVPALVLSATDDVATPPDLGRDLAAALPNARFELVHDAAHLPPLEQPAATAAAISRFLAGSHEKIEIQTLHA